MGWQLLGHPRFTVRRIPRNFNPKSRVMLGPKRYRYGPRTAEVSHCDTANKHFSRRRSAKDLLGYGRWHYCPFTGRQEEVSTVVPPIQKRSAAQARDQS